MANHSNNTYLEIKKNINERRWQLLSHLFIAAYKTTLTLSGQK